MDKTDWDNAPEWANFKTVDPCGMQTWHEYKPKRYMDNEILLAGFAYKKRGRTKTINFANAYCEKRPVKEQLND